MNQVVNKTVTLDLTQIDSNAFSIMGAFERVARKEGWTKEEIDTVLKEAQSSDYDHLLATIVNHTQMPEGDSDIGPEIEDEEDEEDEYEDDSDEDDEE